MKPFLLLGLLAAGAGLGCAPRAPSPERSASAAQAASCRQRADEIYSKQNRAELYRSDTFATGTRDSPFATFGLPGVTSRGLSGRYERDTLVDDCLTSASGPGSPGQGTPAAGSPGTAPGPQ